MSDQSLEPQSLVQTRDLVKYYPIRGGIFLKEIASVKAVDHVSLSIGNGETLGLVGESGCGKTTFGRAILRLEEPTSGEVFFEGENILTYSPEQMRALRKAIQIIFQDPFSSLNPRKTVSHIIGEPLLIHGMKSRVERNERVLELLNVVGLRKEHMRRYPHQFSGGQRQRIGIARALAVNPEFIVCDEAVAALDVSIQAQILNLFMKLREELNLTYLFISHDLGVVEHISDRIVIMYLGRVVETAATEDLFATPNHPYTQALLREVPRLENRRSRFTPVKGEIPSPLDPPAGCHFNPRCPHVMDRCRNEVPMLKEIAPDRFSACHLNDKS